MLFNKDNDTCNVVKPACLTETSGCLCCFCSGLFAFLYLLIPDFHLDSFPRSAFPWKGFHVFHHSPHLPHSLFSISSSSRC